MKLGDVFAIPLPNNRFAFGRRFEDATIAIYRDTSDDMHDVPTNEEYQFIVGVYDKVLKSGEWPIVGNRPFASEEEAWPPPHCVKDMISGGYLIYHKGEMRPSTKEECEGLEIAAVWDAHHIIDRIMGIDIWHK